MSNMILMHGSDHIIGKPEFQKGKTNNDYGRGFYCTRELELAKEWACKNNTDGFVNTYEFDTSELNILNLLEGKYNILNWIALLLQNRTFSINSEIALDAKEYIINNFSVDLTDFDVIIGYRADDSYFSYATSFIENGLPVRSLNQALYLGKLGEQVAIISAKGFEKIKFVDAEPISKEIYYPKFISRDEEARQIYRSKIRGSKSYRDDIFVMDILREEMKSDDPRLQRILSE